MTQQVKKLLVIDKDAAVRTSLKEVLEYESYKVDVEKDTESAFKKICKGGYDLIMSELQMPGMNGVTLLQKLREQDNYVPFIVFVKEVDLDEIVSIMKNGANNVLQKPLNLNKLITSIRQILEENKT
jgi:DNA-binding NtrC family response regulator